MPDKLRVEYGWLPLMLTHLSGSCPSLLLLGTTIKSSAVICVIVRSEVFRTSISLTGICELLLS